MTEWIAPDKGRWLPIGSRVMDLAYLRDGETVYTGEALVLACLLHAKGKTRRGQEEIEHVAKMMRDPNLKRKKNAQKSRKSS